MSAIDRPQLGKTGGADEPDEGSEVVARVAGGEPAADIVGVSDGGTRTATRKLAVRRRGIGREEGDQERRRQKGNLTRQRQRSC